MPPSTSKLVLEQAFREAVELLRGRPVSMSATKAALHVLVRIAAWGRNRVKAVDAGAVPVLVDMHFDDGAEHRACELVLAALDRLCEYVEGRADRRPGGGRRWPRTRR